MKMKNCFLAACSLLLISAFNSCSDVGNQDSAALLLLLSQGRSGAPVGAEQFDVEVVQSDGSVVQRTGLTESAVSFDVLSEGECSVVVTAKESGGAELARGEDKATIVFGETAVVSVKMTWLNSDFPRLDASTGEKPAFVGKKFSYEETDPKNDTRIKKYTYDFQDDAKTLFIITEKVSKSDSSLLKYSKHEYWYSYSADSADGGTIKMKLYRDHKNFDSETETENLTAYTLSEYKKVLEKSEFESVEELEEYFEGSLEEYDYRIEASGDIVITEFYNDKDTGDLKSEERTFSVQG